MYIRTFECEALTVKICMAYSRPAVTPSGQEVTTKTCISGMAYARPLALPKHLPAHIFARPAPVRFPAIMLARLLSDDHGREDGDRGDRGEEHGDRRVRSVRR